MVKKLFKSVTLQILNFIFVSFTIKNFPIWCNINFLSVFTALNSTKIERKFNIINIACIVPQFVWPLKNDPEQVVDFR